MLTEKQVQTDIMEMVKNTPLAQEVTGIVYRDGYRPKDSQLEDITVAFELGYTGQIQNGMVSVCIYVPDIQTDTNNGTWLENGARIAQLEQMADCWAQTLNALNTRYLFTHGRAVTSMPYQEIRHHVIVVKLDYKYF